MHEHPRAPAARESPQAESQGLAVGISASVQGNGKCQRAMVGAYTGAATPAKISWYLQGSDWTMFVPGLSLRPEACPMLIELVWSGEMVRWRHKGMERRRSLCTSTK